MNTGNTSAESHLGSVLLKGKQAAFMVVLESRNFVHSVEHAIRVRDMAVQLAREEGLHDRTAILALELAAYWHDTGRNDWQIETACHAQASVKKFRVWAQLESISEDLASQVESIIVSHRKGRDPVSTDVLSSLFWDADKLDIFNVPRTQQLLDLYMLGVRSPAYDRTSSLQYWSEFSSEFRERFKTAAGKRNFEDRFPEFCHMIAELVVGKRK